MKQSKRILAIALALALGLAVFATGVAADDPYVPPITKQPKPIALVFTGKELKLELEMAPLSEGWTISIAWYEVGEDEPVATGAKASIPINNDSSVLDDLKNAIKTVSYYAVVTCTYTDGGGSSMTYSKISESTKVYVMPSISDVFSFFWAYVQMDYGPLFGIGVITIGSPFLLPMALMLLCIYGVGYFGSLLVKLFL